jgi:hypothetical protein
MITSLKASEKLIESARPVFSLTGGDDIILTTLNFLGAYIMPKLYEYFGLIILFYSNEHEPIHVHGKYQDSECKAELIIENGQIVEIRISPVRGRKPLDRNKLNDFRAIVEQYAEEIVQKWIDYFVLHRAVESEQITRKI